MTTSTQASVLSLTPFDYCDACATAQALVLVQTPKGLHLAFCRHDYEKLADSLGYGGCTVIVDDRGTS